MPSLPRRQCNICIKRKVKNEFYFSKLIMKKAYDRVDWNFLKLTLADFGFPQPTINLIMQLTISLSLALQWNSEKLDNFEPKRGLRQGDPVSPYLFVLCMEKLALLIQQMVRENKWKMIVCSLQIYHICSLQMIVSISLKLSHLKQSQSMRSCRISVLLLV